MLQYNAFVALLMAVKQAIGQTNLIKHENTSFQPTYLAFWNSHFLASLSLCWLQSKLYIFTKTIKNYDITTHRVYLEWWSAKGPFDMFQ